MMNNREKINELLDGYIISAAMADDPMLVEKLFPIPSLNIHIPFQPMGDYPSGTVYYRPLDEHKKEINEEN